MPETKVAPLLITGCAIFLVCWLHLLSERMPGFTLLRRLEWMTYDWRMRLAYTVHNPVYGKLGFVYIGDDAVWIFSEGRLGTNLQFGLYWPRHVYGRVVRELKAQGARAVALDELFDIRRFDHPQVLTSNGPVDSDRVFQMEIKKAGNVLLGATREAIPHPLFRKNALGMGDISIDRDADGVLRRMKAYHDYRIWHPEIAAEARLENWDLDMAVIESNRITFPRMSKAPAILEISEDGYFDPSDLAPSRKPATGFIRLEKAFEDVRVWHLGLTLAALELGLDLEKAQVDLAHNRITFRGSNGVERVVPVDHEGRFLVDWSVRLKDSALTKDAFETLVANDILRARGTQVPSHFRDKLVIIGSIGSGNNFRDRGATPLEKDTFLTSNHWNVANSLLANKFITESSRATALALIACLGLLSSAITLRLRVPGAAAVLGLLFSLYIVIGLIVFIQSRYCMPFITPLGMMLLSHGALVSYRAGVDQSEKRRIKHVFSRIVSPNVVHELIKVEDLSLIGSRREVSIMFADVRGFTEMTDEIQAEVEEYIHSAQLSPAEAKAYSDARAQEILETVNRYLGTIADVVKKHEGTLDKYIGDCVMAFWGAPSPNEKHALACVRAAIEAQRAIHAVNLERALDNQCREIENLDRVARGKKPLPMLTLLSLGTGINTGIVTVGLMGSESHIQNYTVFGREVNLAARLEPVSGRGRILIGEGTYHALLRDAPELAATCVAWEPTRLKGFQTPVKLYEVTWGDRALRASEPGTDFQPISKAA